MRLGADLVLEERLAPAITVPAMSPTYSIVHDSSLTATANGSSGIYGVLQNVTTDTNNPLTIIEINGSSSDVGNAITLPSGANLTINADGGFGYVAAANAAYTEWTLTVKISDGISTANMSFQIAVTNATPTISSVSFNSSSPKTNENLTATVSGNDADGDTITYQYTWTVNGNIVRTNTTSATTDSLDLSQPGNGDRGDSIIVSVNASDGIATTSMPSYANAGVINSAPVVTSNTAAVNEDSSLAVTIGIFFADPDGDTLSGAIASQAAYGEADVADGNVVYTPFPSFNGADSFSIDISDGQGGAITSSLSVTVQPLVYLERSEFLAHQDDTATMIVSLTGVSSQDITVHYATSNGTAEAGIDYTATEGTVTIEAGQTSATIAVPILTDPNADDLEKGNLTLSAPANAGLGARTQVSFAIVVALDEDEDPLPRLNELHDEIQSRLTDIDGVIARAEPTDPPGILGVFTFMNTKTSNMTAALRASPVDMTTYINEMTEYQDAWNAVNDTSSLRALLQQVRDIANVIMVRATEAAEKSQGEKFRILGVSVTLGDLRRQLATIFNELESQRAGLETVRTEMQNVPGDQSRRVEFLNVLRNEFEQEKNLLGRLSLDTGTVFTIGMAVLPPEGNSTITNLNDIYNAISELSTTIATRQLVIEAAGLAMTVASGILDAASSESAWSPYVSLTIEVLNNATAQANDIGVHVAEDEDLPEFAFSMYDLARLAYLSGPADDGDIFALIGIRHVVTQSTAILTRAREIAQMQIDWIGTLGSLQGKTHIDSALSNLVACVNTIDEALMVIPEL